MRTVKIVAFVIFCLFLIFLTAAAIAPKEFSTTKSIDIELPQQEVFDFLKLLQNQELYSKWAEMDPDMEKGIRGTDGTIGAVGYWASKNPDVGTGEQTITAMEEPVRIDYQLVFTEPFPSKSDAWLQLKTTDHSQHTRVEWGFSTKTAYPFNLMVWAMNLEKMIGDDYDYGLKKLKNLLESQYAVTPDAPVNEALIDSGSVGENP